MRLTLLSRRAISYSALAFASATMLVACDTVEPVAPMPAASAPTAASLALSGGGGRNNTSSLTIFVVDENGDLVKTGIAQFLVQNTTTGNGFFVLDNNHNDTDMKFGKLVVKGLVAGTYSVCQNNQAPVGYTLPKIPCQTAIVGGIVAGKVTFVNPSLSGTTAQ